MPQSTTIRAARRRVTGAALTAAVVAALVGFGAAVPAQAAAPFTITGKIVDSAGAAVAGATVNTPSSCRCGDISTIPGASTTTAADGSFSVTVRDYTSVALSVDPPAPFVDSALAVDGTLTAGWVADTKAITASTSIGTVTLARGVALSGTVAVAGFPAATGQGFINIGSASTGYYSAAFPAANGTHAWTAYVPQGSYTVTAYAGRSSAPYNGGRVVPVGASGQAVGVETVVGGGYAIRGKTVDPDGRPAAGVVVDVYKADGNSNLGAVKSAADGTYTIIDVPAGQYKISYESGKAGGGSTYGYWPGLVPIDQGGVLTVGGALRVVPVPAPDVVIPRGAPSEPRAVSAVAGNASATVSWQAPAKPGPDNIHPYKYTVTASPGGKTVVTPASSTSVKVAGLANGTAYTFTVVATNGLGDSPVSTASTAVTPTAPPVAKVPGAPTGVTGKSGNAAATATWVAPASDGGSPITSYVVVAKAGQVVYGSTTVASTARKATVTGLQNGRAVTLIVTAKNAVGTSPAGSTATTVTPAGPPTAPTTVKAVPGDAQAVVSWVGSQANGSSITGYVVTSSPGGKTVTVGATSRTATVKGLTNGTKYTFTVKAKNAIGSSPASAVSNAVTPKK